MCSAPCVTMGTVIQDLHKFSAESAPADAGAWPEGRTISTGVPACQRGAGDIAYSGRCPQLLFSGSACRLTNLASTEVRAATISPLSHLPVRRSDQNCGPAYAEHSPVYLVGSRCSTALRRSRRSKARFCSKTSRKFIRELSPIGCDVDRFRVEGLHLALDFPPTGALLTRLADSDAQTVVQQ